MVDNHRAFKIKPRQRVHIPLYRYKKHRQRKRNLCKSANQTVTYGSGAEAKNVWERHTGGSIFTPLLT